MKSRMFFYRNIVNNAFTEKSNDTDSTVSDKAVPYVANEMEIKNLVIEIVELLREKVQIPKLLEKGLPR